LSQLEHEAEVNMLKRSKEIVGYQQPVVIDKSTGQVVDGRHRKEADPRWPEVVKEFTPKERVLYRIHANMARRDVGRKERGAELAELALILEDEGVPRDQIARGVVNLVDFLTEKYVLSLLPSKYKAEKKREAGLRSARARAREPAEAPPTPPQPTGEGVAQPTGAAAPTPTPTPPRPPVQEKPTCPFCHMELEKILCPRCWRELFPKKVVLKA